MTQPYFEKATKARVATSVQVKEAQAEGRGEQFPRTIFGGSPIFWIEGVGNLPTYAPALLLQDCAYSYRVWITLIKLLYAPLQYLKINPDIHLAE